MGKGGAGREHHHQGGVSSRGGRRGELCYLPQNAARRVSMRSRSEGKGLMARTRRRNKDSSAAGGLARRKVLHLARASGAVAISRAADADTWPSQPIRFVVGFPPGGGADIVSRIMAAWLSQRLGGQGFIQR